MRQAPVAALPTNATRHLAPLGVLETQQPDGRSEHVEAREVLLVVEISGG
jgi:hypothetical protein